MENEVISAHIRKTIKCEKIGFIAGPYIGDGSYPTINRNIVEAEQVAIQLANRGIYFFCPHTHTSHFGAKSSAPESFYKEMDLLFLKQCDFLVATPMWTESSGAREEIDECRKTNTRIFYLATLYDVNTYNLIEKFAKS